MMDIIALAGNLLLFALVFGMSATVDIDCLKEQAGNYRAILTGIFCQFLILPFLGFVVVKTLQLPAEQGITLLVVTSSPGGSYSNWWCSLFNASLALSVTMTAISTILSVFMLPANLLLYTQLCYHADVLGNLDWTALFTALVIVMTAITLGLLCSAKIHSRRFNKAANHLGNISGFALIVFSATMTNTGDADTKIWSRDWSFYVGTAMPCFFGLLLAVAVASAFRLDPPERVTVAIEACYQNVGIATSLALTMFEGNQLNDAMGVPFFYGVVEALFVGIFCLGAWKAGWTKAPADAPIWRVLFTSYEVVALEESDVNQIEVDVSDSNETTQSSEERTDGNILTTYFNLAWLDPTPAPKSSSSTTKDDPKAAVAADKMSSSNTVRKMEPGCV